MIFDIDVIKDFQVLNITPMMCSSDEIEIGKKEAAREWKVVVIPMFKEEVEALQRCEEKNEIRMISEYRMKYRFQVSLSFITL